MVGSGKETRNFMGRVVYGSLGRPSSKVMVGPGEGLDNGVFSLGGGRVMILTVDPVSAIPALGMKLSAWLSVHLIASDYTTSGNDPELATFSYNFPGSMKREDRVEYVMGVGEACSELGVTIVGGHTGSYPGAGFTVIGAGSMIGFAAEGKYVAPSMARVGDRVLMTKSAAIEATFSLAASFPAFVGDRAGGRLAARARKMVRLCTTVEDARAARKVGLWPGGVTSMHDATEGGILGALSEMASASGKSFEIDKGKIPVSPEAAGVCGAFGLDPLLTMGEGALLVTCSASRLDELHEALGDSAIKAAEIGEVRKGNGLVISDGKKRKAYQPQADKYWAAYSRSARLKLS